jgi:hypothetical protein
MVLISKKEKAMPIHHRKRIGQHHKRSKQYDKHYWPYLPLLAIAGFSLLLNAWWAPISQTIINHDVLSYATSTSPVGLLQATNIQRSAQNEAELQLNSQLSAAAQAKANDMVQRNYWSHVTPDGNEPWWFVNKAGYQYQSVGENLAYGFTTSDTTIAGWMNSPGHRANILNSQYQDVGFGIANSDNFDSNGQQTIVVAMYGLAATTAATTASTPANSVATHTPATEVPASATSKPANALTNTANPGTVAAAQTTTSTPTDTTADHAVITPTTPDASSTQHTIAAANTSSTTQSHQVLRLQVVAAKLPAGGLLATLLAIAAAGGLLIYRHTRALHRYVAKGEAYVVGHPAIDITVMFIVSVGLVVTRTAGYIR